MLTDPGSLTPSAQAPGGRRSDYPHSQQRRRTRSPAAPDRQGPRPAATGREHSRLHPGEYRPRLATVGRPQG
ncbi:hypothetical protein P4114_20350 [Pseudomonas aeruginosa]|nr:hypothetical protein [Pseudomonas aeruginosa]